MRHTDPSGHCIGWVWGAADCHFVQSVDQLDWDGAADNVQTALDVAGLIPGIGEPFDAANAAISAARGDMVGAGLSAAAMVPLAGGGASAGKLLAKYGDEAATLGKTVYNPNGVLADWGHIYAQRVDDLPGYFDIIGHGTADAMEDMSAAEVAKYLKENGAQLGYAGEPLRLLSCSTGASPCGFAQQLANEMGVDVLAPSTDLLVRYDGAMSLVPPDGIWRLFTPQ